ncbi:MAG: glycosyltransferase, partial [Sedimentisphaerales bacterium]
HRLVREMTLGNPAYGDCPIREWSRVARRYRIFTNYMNQGLIDHVFTTTIAKKEFIANRGFQVEFIPFGYHSIFGQLQGHKRDIDVLFLGRLNNERRRRVIDRLFDELRANGVELTIIDRDYYNEGRTELLNRTKIMLNLLRVPWDFGPERFLMSMSCGALVVSEKIVKPEPYRPGVHFVQAQTQDLAAIICQYLKNDNEREKITHCAYEFVMGELQLEKKVLQLLKSCHLSDT